MVCDWLLEFAPGGLVLNRSESALELHWSCTGKYRKSGQALSWAASQAGVDCHVAVPEGAPEVKVQAIKSYGGNVHY